MKKISCIFLLLLFSAIVDAQSLKSVIKGNTDGFIPYLLLSWEKQGGLNRVVDTIQVKEDNTFNYQINVSEPTVGFLIVGNNKFNVWLKAGALTEVRIQDGKPKFAGDAGVYATYFAEDQNLLEEKFKEYKAKYPDFDEGSSLYNDRYFEIMDSITSERLSFLKRYFKGSSKAEQEFLDFQTNSLIYTNLYYKLAYPESDLERFSFYQKKHSLDKGNTYTFSDRVEFKDTLLLPNPYYSGFVTQLIADIALGRTKAGGSKFAIEPYVDFAMRAVDELTEGAATAPKFKALLLNKVVEDISLDNKRAWIVKVNSTLTELSSKYEDKSLSFVKEKLDKVTEELRFMKGDQAPAFTLKDLKGKTYTLQDFKGKKIYLDLGASWCPPCIEGIPAWNKLVDDYSEREDVVFISLSLDAREEQWQRWVKRYKPKGVLLYAGEGGYKSKFAKDYNVRSIPRFILLDEAGKIEAFFAPDPKSIREMLSTKK